MKPSYAEAMGRRVCRRFRLLSLSAAALVLLTLGATGEASEPLPRGVFAIIDGETIPQAEFETYLAGFARSRYYHGLTAARLAEIRPEAEESFVRNRLLLREAERRGLAGDPDQVERRIAALEERYGGSDSWPGIEAKLPELRARLLDTTKIESLEAEIKALSDPPEETLESFYRENIGLFTLPRQARLSVILVGVPPHAFADERQAAEEKASAIHERLQAGEEFAELAREHSTHDSAEKGGDIGFLHRGELAASAQQAVDRLAPGDLTPPIQVLEGYAIFKLVERRPGRVQPLAAVRERALALYRREKSTEAWETFVSALRTEADVRIDTTEAARRPQGD